MVWAGLTTSFAGLEWLLVCSRQPHMLIKIVQGRGAGRAKAQQPKCPCLWQERVHFRSRWKYIDREISPEESFFFFFAFEFQRKYWYTFVDQRRGIFSGWAKRQICCELIRTSLSRLRPEKVVNSSRWSYITKL